MSFFGIPIRNGLSLGLGTVASLTNGPGFLPSELYYDGTVQGAWYDPSDVTTLFQNSAGTTPVTAVEQPVGLMLDKSKGLVLGPELVTNVGGPFTATTGYFAAGGATLSVSGGYLVVTNGSYGTATTTLAIPSGKYYKLIVNIGAGTTGIARIVWQYGQAGSQDFDFAANVGVKVIYVRATVNNPIVGLTCLSPTAGDTMSFYSLSVKEIPGNHAYQSTSASRPTLRARYNLLTYSEEFNNAAWTRGSLTISANATTAPDGTNTADKIQETNANAEHYALQGISATATSYTFSVYLKAAERTWANIYFVSAGSSKAYFDLANGVVGTLSPGVAATISNAGNGWWRCQITVTATAATFYAVINPALGDNQSIVYAGTTGSGIFLWGAQITQTAVFPSNTYQRIGAATDYATGAAFPPYLFFDGTDDSMLTNSVDFSATDKMLVVAGVTKNSDAVASVVAELSPNQSLNNGSFFVGAAVSGADYWFTLRGTSSTAFGATTFTAPNTAVLSVAMNIAGAARATELFPRVNGAIPTLTGADSADAGTGNFGNYPLYIGRRNNASSPFNGNIYSLIIAGQSYSSGQISSTESWVAAKTPLGTI